MIEIEARLDELKALGLHRRTRLVSGPQGPHVVLDGKPVLMLCSNNYLGLADHPRLREAAADAAMRWGIVHAEGRGALIVTDSVFSMDGDVAPLTEIAELAQRFGLRTVVDEAHATGCLGPGGRGAVAEAGLDDEIDVVVGTLGKALGSYGAFVACDQRMAQYLVNAARTFIFSTALPPSAVAGAMAALDLLAERPRLVARLTANAAALRTGLEREGFDVGASRTQILPLVIGEAQRTMRICEAALARGVFAQAIRPPTVPDMTSRLRLAVMATHREEELRAAARVLGEAARAAGWAPTAAAVGGLTSEIEPEHAQREAAHAFKTLPGVFDFEAPEPIRRAA